MPLIGESGEGKAKPCARCQKSNAVLVVRAEYICRECFMKYVATKVLKRLETNKIRGGFKEPQKTLLLPISFGVSSITLLHVLDQQLQHRVQQGRHAGYDLQVIFIDQSTVLEQADIRATLDILKQRYPSHTYTTISLEDCFEYDITFRSLSGGEEDRLPCILSNLPSVTSKVDFIDVTRRRLILAFAKRSGIDAILFGDSTTRLAERTLSETAKGRGVALPWLTADGITDGIKCIYPMRDLLRKEILAYASIISPPLLHLIVENTPRLPASSKNTSIDGLMSQYFESVEQSYPSIVANVVRTSGRLAAVSVPEDCQSCSVCGQPIPTDLSESWGGEQQSATPSQSIEGHASRTDTVPCYGCARTILKH